MTASDYSLYRTFQKNSQQFGEKEAFITVDASVSHAQFLEHVDKLAGGLVEHGISKGDRVCILALNSIEFMELYGACAKIGAIVFPINWRLSASEVRDVIALAEPKMLIVDADQTPSLEEVDINKISICATIGTSEVDGFIQFEKMYATTVDPEETIGDDDPLAIISTAAVAGLPRGAILTHKNFAMLGEQFIETFSLSENDRFLAVLPFFHIAGLNQVLGISQAGGASVIMGTFDPAAGAKLIDDHQVTLMGTFPPMLDMLLSAREQIEATWESLRFCFGILNPPDTVKRLLTETKAAYWTGYGQAETTGIVTLVNVMEKPGSAGKAISLLKMRCVDESGEDVPLGQPGEIVVQGPLVFAGYWRDEDATKFAGRYGWHHTGDIGKLDEDGYLYFVGRKPEKELIKSGGENIYPAEVEFVIRSLPEVADVCVIGVADEKWGEAVKAVVELTKGETISADEIIKAVAGQIASYKKPHSVDFVDELPRQEDGEIDRGVVKSSHG